MDIVTDWVYQKNRWFDDLPYQEQFLTAFWSSIFGLAFILLIVLYTGAPFGILVGAAVAVTMIPRVIYRFGYMEPSPWLPPAPPGPSKVEIIAPDWAFSLNHWFENKPSHERIVYVAGATIALFAFNMLLHGVLGFPFGLLFLVVVLILAMVRVGYHYGWLVPKPGSLISATPPAAPAPVAMQAPPEPT
jgi:hypothetical protein